jgi:ABC-2 type transport system permease protein
MRRLVTDTMVVAERNLVRLPRAPDLLLAFTVEPVMFVLLFVYVFGGAIQTPGYEYVDFLIPGIIVQNIAFGGFVTALGLNEDLNKGLIDRFRSLPMARPAVLAGRTLADVVTNFLSVIVLLVTGLIIGFSFDAGIGEIVGGLALLLLFGYAFSWVFALLGLLVSSPESANSVGFIAVFPLTFISSAFVPVESMPSALQWFAEINPFTVTVDAMRALRARRRQRVGRGRVVAGDHRRVRAAGRRALPQDRRSLTQGADHGLPSRSRDANVCSCPARPRSCTPTSTPSSRRSPSATTRSCSASP